MLQRAADADMSDRDKLAAELQAAEVEYRAALADETVIEPVVNDSETAEIRELAGRASAEFGSAFDSMVNRRAPDGAFSELQDAYGLPAHLIPLRLLEDRAAITGLADEPSAPQEMRPYIFPRSIAAFMGFDMPRLAYGSGPFPSSRLRQPSTARRRARTLRKATGVIGADALTPGRRQGSLRYRREQAAEFPQLADGVRAHVSAALVSAIDALALDSTDGLRSITEPTDPRLSQTTFDNYIAAFNPDGRYAASLGEINVIVGGKTFEHMRGRYRNNQAPNSAYQTLRADGLSVRVASGIPAPVSNDQEAFSVLGPALGHGVIPVWDGVEVIADPFTASNEGRNHRYHRGHGSHQDVADRRLDPASLPARLAMAITLTDGQFAAALRIEQTVIDPAVSRLRSAVSPTLTNGPPWCRQPSETKQFRGWAGISTTRQNQRAGIPTHPPG